MTISVDAVQRAWPTLSSEEKRRLYTYARLSAPPMRFAEFFRQAWPVINPRQPLVWSWHLDLLCFVCEKISLGKVTNVIVNIQPRSLKSTVFSVAWPAWEWTFRPQTRWVTASYASALATRDTTRSRRLIKSDWYQREFGNVFQLAGDQDQKGRYDNTFQGFRLASSVGGSSTGEGGDRILVDDPLKASDAFSDARRKAANNWWDYEMSTRLDDPQKGARIIVMQRLHADDLTGHVLKKAEQGGEQYEHVVIRAEHEPDRPTMFLGMSVDPRTQAGELMDPTRRGRDAIDKLKVTLGSSGAAAQLQQEPGASGSGLFEIEWFKCWVPAGMDLGPAIIRSELHGDVQLDVVPLPTAWDLQLQSWDMPFKDTGSYCCGQVWGIDGSRTYLLHQLRKRLLFPEILKQIKRISVQYPEAELKLIEDKANGPATIQMLSNSITGLVPFNPVGDKVTRAAAASPQVEAGNIVVPHPALASWVETYLLNMAAFPNAEYDDEVDATSQALNRVQLWRLMAAQ